MMKWLIPFLFVALVYSLLPDVKWLKDMSPYPIKSFPEWKKRLVLSAEDPDFYKHHGFDFKRIRRAAKWDLTGHKPIRGASGISQQLVKNMFLTKDRTIGRKFIETLLTIKLERSLTKDRILALYMSFPNLKITMYHKSLTIGQIQ